MQKVELRPVIMLGCIALLSGCGPSEADYTVFSTIKDQRGQNRVIIENAHSALAYGPETIRVHVKKLETGERVHVVTTKIANDGGGLSSENIRSEWDATYLRDVVPH